MIQGRERNASVISDDACVLIKFDHFIYKKYIHEGAVTELLLRSYYIAGHPLFRTWLSSHRDLIAENLKLRHFKFGEEIFHAGSNVKSVYFVLEGQVKLTINPSANLGEYSKLLIGINPTSPDQKKWSSKEFQHLDPSRNLTVIERRKLRREEGYYASERRYREMSICVLGEQGIIGDVEATLDLPTYTTTAVCIQELKLYEIKKANFMQLILNKNKETHEKMRLSVHEKLEYRNSISEGGIPIYNALLTYFQKAQPKDSRKQILKAYNAKRQSQKIVSNEFFSEMSKGRTNNRLQVSDHNSFEFCDNAFSMGVVGGCGGVISLLYIGDIYASLADPLVFIDHMNMSSKLVSAKMIK